MDFNIPTIIDSYGGGGSKSNPQYIIKDEDGNQVAFTAMMEMSLNSSSQLPSEPIEKGSFANYNRIINPYEGTCRLALEGDDGEIQQALDGLEELKKGLKKIELITPFSSYENLMLESYDYRRDGHSGFNVLQVDIRVKEIREVAAARTTTSVEEAEEEAGEGEAEEYDEEDCYDASCVSEEDEGQYSMSSPSSADVEASNGDGERTSTLYDLFGEVG
jgi:hypothetical protein